MTFLIANPFVIIVALFSKGFAFPHNQPSSDEANVHTGNDYYFWNEDSDELKVQSGENESIETSLMNFNTTEIDQPLSTEIDVDFSNDYFFANENSDESNENNHTDALESNFSASHITHTVTQKISGGSTAKVFDFPYQVRINHTSTEGNQMVCGGAIISPFLVTTAAHCVFNNKDEIMIEANGIEVTAGIQNLDAEESTRQTRQVMQIIAHESYDYLNFTHDIAILGLSTAFHFNEFVNKIDIPKYKVKYTGNATTSGWGVTQNSYGNLSRSLQKVEIPIVPFKNCTEQYKMARIKLPINKDSQLCAGTQTKDSCKGDSGGPLVCNSWTKNGKKVLCGITSFGGDKCGFTNIPGIYTDVASFRFWIAKAVKQFTEYRELMELISKEKQNNKRNNAKLKVVIQKINRLEEKLQNLESTPSAQVQIFSKENYHGSSLFFPLSKCKNFDNFHAASLNTHGSCVVAFQKENCQGVSSIFHPLRNESSSVKPLKLKSVRPCRDSDPISIYQFAKTETPSTGIFETLRKRFVVSV